MKAFFEFIGALLLIAGLVFVAYLLMGFGWSTLQISGSAFLDAVAGVICLIWLLVILKVPWDLYFEAGRVLFEMQRSAESGIAVCPDRRSYVQRLRRWMLVLAVGAHVFSALLIAAITYWSNGRTGYFFALFYLVSTLFRPASEGYRFLTSKLKEIESEVRYPREDIHKLKSDLKGLEQSLKDLEERVSRDEGRLTSVEEKATELKQGYADLTYLLERSEAGCKNRMESLQDEVERSLLKALDQQEIVAGLRSFARLIKEA